ncbi:MAG: transcriptional repressor [Candidatus Omnitrophica bacterium]|nr:transcriptional repressor [Candidatus Omnitrophota bacterium]MCM8831861.1 transcriptional repressor [Candidatus Omnitrophota bacterium]
MKKEIKRRLTKQRSIILEELRKTKSHPTADIIFKMVRKKLPTISFGTVYRNLNFLRDQGEILELVCGKYSSRYDGDAKPHYHFFCLKCQKILDLDMPVLENLDEKVRRKLKVDVRYHRIDFYGYCQECKNKSRDK